MIINKQGTADVGVFYFPFRIHSLSICIKSISVLLLFIISIPAYCVSPLLSDVVVSNVTDRSFSIIWTSNQPGQAVIELYSDAAGSIPVASGITLKPYNVYTGNPAFNEANRQVTIDSIVTAAKSSGIFEVTVSGLNVSTNYFVKFGVTEELSSDTTLCPDAGAGLCPDSYTRLIDVVTEQEPARTTASGSLFLNDMLFKPSAGAVSGELIIVSAESANYPVSSFVGDGVSVPYAVLDFNNFFSKSLNTSLLLNGSTVKSYGDIGENLVVRHYKGLGGSQTSIQLVNINQQQGALMVPVNRAYGDCNSNGRVDGYDHLLIANVIAGKLLEKDFLSSAFHPVACNLYKEEGLNSLATQVVIDAEDKDRLEALLIGKTSSSTLPEAP